jgi:hypothetical protein
MLENINNQQMQCLEVIGAKVTLGKYVVKIISIYRSPSSNQVESIKDLDKLLQSLGNGNAIIAGDVNFNLAKQTNITLDYENLLTNHGFNQSVKFFTRLTAESASVLDHVISNINDIESMVTHEMCADHQTIISVFGNKGKIKSMSKSNSYVRADKIHITETIDNLKEVDWLNWNNWQKDLDIDSTYQSFQTIIK